MVNKTIKAKKFRKIIIQEMAAATLKKKKEDRNLIANLDRSRLQIHDEVIT